MYFFAKAATKITNYRKNTLSSATVEAHRTLWEANAGRGKEDGDCQTDSRK